MSRLSIFTFASIAHFVTFVSMFFLADHIHGAVLATIFLSVLGVLVLAGIWKRDERRMCATRVLTGLVGADVAGSAQRSFKALAELDASLSSHIRRTLSSTFEEDEVRQARFLVFPLQVEVRQIRDRLESVWIAESNRSNVPTVFDGERHVSPADLVSGWGAWLTLYGSRTHEVSPFNEERVPT